MNFDMATQIWCQMRSTQMVDLRDDLGEVAVRYARMRVDYLFADTERQGTLGADRTACHNSLIASCDILARNMAQRGEDAQWRQQLGDDRKVIGDFACYLHAILGIAAR